jgi:hypothetical protein
VSAELDELQVLSGTRMLTARELAPRIGRKVTERGIRSVMEEAKAGIIPAIKSRGVWLFHWPTVQKVWGKAK